MHNKFTNDQCPCLRFGVSLRQSTACSMTQSILQRNLDIIFALFLTFSPFARAFYHFVIPVQHKEHAHTHTYIHTHTHTYISSRIRAQTLLILNKKTNGMAAIPMFSALVTSITGSPVLPSPNPIPDDWDFSVRWSPATTAFHLVKEHPDLFVSWLMSHDGFDGTNGDLHSHFLIIFIHSQRWWRPDYEIIRRKSLIPLSPRTRTLWSFWARARVRP